MPPTEMKYQIRVPCLPYMAESFKNRVYLLPPVIPNLQKAQEWVSGAPPGKESEMHTQLISHLSSPRIFQANTVSSL